MATRLSLYTSETCGYCAQVDYAARTLGVELEHRDVAEPEHRGALLEATGRGTVPVLRVEEDGEVRWLPQSLEIIRYLKQSTGQGDRVPAWVDKLLGPANTVAPLLVLGSFLAPDPAGPLLLVTGIGLVVAGLIRRATIMRVRPKQN